MAHSTNQDLSTFSGLTKGGSLPELYSSSVVAPGPVLSHEGARSGEMTIPAWKRALDIAIVLLTAPMWGPLMLFIMLWIKAVSSGPVFFKQIRIGLSTREFTMLKFRSMKVGAETASHENHFKTLVENDVPMTKLDSLKDKRIIPGGRLLRMTGLDELPQLFNVLRGEMSIVGPRPCTPNELDHYTGTQKARFNLLPGITGYWQVNGKNNTTFNQMVEMDIKYGERASLLLDLVIMLRTFPALAKQAIETRLSQARRRSEPPETAASKAA